MPGIVIDFRRFAEIRERHRARSAQPPPETPALLDAPDPAALEADVATADGPVPVAVVERRRRRARRAPAWLGGSLWPFPRRP